MSRSPAGDDLSVDSLLGRAADEFTRRLARGEQPDVEEYAERYPQIAATIREVFPALQVMPSIMTEAGDSDAKGAPAGDTPAVGSLGDYRLVREIGRGGMGIVYEAEQISLGRRVALKVLSFAAVLDQRQLQRFKNEAQAAAQLHHTNIVPVFSVGCERGVHYYAMQYIEGHPLSAVIRELRQLGGLDPREGAPSSERASEATTAARTLPVPYTAARPAASGSSAAAGLPLQQTTSAFLETITADGSTRSRAFFQSLARLAIQGAEALQHAHERGVIHRDIKPSNLLLDAAGTLWVADFGLATMPTDPGLTVTGDLLGTIRYMSPEQALAKRVPLDHRTDIYSLGVTLYELLSLEPAYTGRDREELLRQIAHEEPRPLRRVNDAIPRELEVIVGKAMAKNTGDRYGTARDLADDLRRFLEDKPIRARPPTLADRTAKWSRRHRSVVVTSLVLLVLSVVGLSISTILIARERREALHQRDIAKEQRASAEANLQRAREALDRMLTRVAAVDPASVPDSEKLRLALQQEELETAKALADRNPEPDVLRNLALAYVRVGDTRAQLGQAQRAERAYRDAIEVFEKLRNQVPETAEYHLGLAKTYVCLGTRLWERRRHDEAETMARRACSLMTQIPGQPPLSRTYRQQLAGGFDLQGLVLRDTGRLHEAEVSLREAVRLRQQLVAETPDSVEASHYRVELTGTQRNLAGLLLKAGRQDEAENVIRGAISALESRVSSLPDDSVCVRELALTRRWWDEVMRLDDARLGVCERAGGPAETERSASAGAGPDSTAGSNRTYDYNETLNAAHRAFDDALNMTGRSDAAEAAYGQAVTMVERLASDHPTTAKYREDLALLHQAKAKTMMAIWRLKDAETALLKALEIEKRLASDFPNNPDYHARLDESRANLDSVRSRMQVDELVSLGGSSADGAARAVELAHTMDESAISGDSLLLRVYANYLALGGSYERAEAALRKAIELDPINAATRRSLGVVLLGLGRRQEAMDAFRETLAVLGIQTADEAVNACPEPNTVGYFLDMVNQDQFVDRWRGIVVYGARLDSWPWFFIGMRAELEERRGDALIAYSKAVELGRTPHSHCTANWAAYRLRMLMNAVPSSPAPTSGKARSD